MEASKKPSTQKVWSTRKGYLTAKGTLEQLLIDGVHPTYCDGRMFYPVFLFHSKRKWWLNYGQDRNTGHFDSKKEAVAWWTNGGR